MAINRETFDYQGYIDSGLAGDIQIQPDQELTDQDKDTLYKSFFEGYASDLEASDQYKGKNKRSDIAWQLADDFDDGRELLGLPEAENDFQVNAENFVKYASETNTANGGDLGDVELSDFVDRYAEDVVDNFRYPGYRPTDDSFYNTTSRMKGRVKADIMKSLALEGVENPEFDDNTFDLKTSLSDNLPRLDARIQSRVVTNPADEPTVEQVEQSTIEERGTALGFSVDQAQKLAGSGLKTVAEYFDLDGLADASQNFIEKQDREIKENNYVPTYNGSFNDQEGLVNTLGWVFEKAQENIVSSGVALGGSAAAVFTAPISAPLALAIGGTTLLGTTALSIGAVRQEFEEQGIFEEGDQATVIGTGLAVAALDKISGGAASKPFSRQLVKELGKSGVLKKIGKSALTEAGTEAAQESLQVGVAYLNGGEYEASEVVNRLVDASVIGGFLGGTTSAATTVAVRGEPTDTDTRVEPTLTDTPAPLEETPVVDDTPIDQPVTLDETPAVDEDGGLSSDEVPEPVQITHTPKTKPSWKLERAAIAEGVKLSLESPDSRFDVVESDDGFVVVETQNAPGEVAPVDELAVADELLADPVDELAVVDELLADPVDELAVADELLLDEETTESITETEVAVEESGDPVEVNGVTFTPGEDFNFNNPDAGVIKSIEVNADGDTIATVTESEGQDAQYNLTNPREDIGDDEIVGLATNSRTSEGVEFAQSEIDDNVVAKRGDLVGVGATQEEALVNMLTADTERKKKRKAKKEQDTGPTYEYAVEPEVTTTSLIDFDIQRVETKTGTLAEVNVTLSDPEGITEALENNGFEDVTVAEGDFEIKASKGGTNYTIQVKPIGKSLGRNIVILGGPQKKVIKIVDSKGAELTNGMFEFTTFLSGASANTETRGEQESGKFFEVLTFQKIAEQSGGDLDVFSANLARISYPNGQQILFDNVDNDTVGVQVNSEPKQLVRVDSLSNGKRVTSLLVKRTEVKDPDAKKKNVKRSTSDEDVVFSRSTDRVIPAQAMLDVEDINQSVDQTLSRSTVTTPKQASVIANDDVTVTLETQGVDTDVLLNDIEAETVMDFDTLAAVRDGVTSNKPTYDWDPADIIETVKGIVPSHIFKTMRFHTDSDNPLRRVGAAGWFKPASDNQGNYFDIDLSNRQMSEDEIIDVIGHELAHLTQESFVTTNEKGERVGLLKDAYDKMYAVIKDEAVASLKPYFIEAGIDPDNPTDAQQLLIVNEFLANQQTTFLDYLNTREEKSALVDRDSIQAIKKQLSEGNDVTNILIDMTQDFEGEAGQARGIKLLESMLTAQAAKALGKGGFTVTYKQVAEAETDVSEIRVTSTRYGSRVDTILNNETFRRSQENKDLERLIASLKGNTDFESRRKTAKAQVKLFLRRLNPFRTYIDEGFISYAVGGDKSGRVTFQNTRNRDAIIDQDNQSNLRRYGISRRDGNDQRSYQQMFLDAGVTNKKVIDQAKIVDERVLAGVEVVYEGAARIHHEYSRMQNIVDTWRDNELITPQTAAVMKSTLRSASRKIKGSYQNAKYSAHMAFDKVNLNRMLNDLTSTNNQVDSRAEAAEFEIAEIQKATPVGTKLSARKAARLASLNNDVDVRTRRDALERLADSNLAERGVGLTLANRTQEMINIVNDAITTSNEINNVGLEKIQNVDATRAKRLDPENDKDEVAFLGLITDPAEQLMYTVEQQFKMTEALRSSTVIAELGMRFGYTGILGDANTSISTLKGGNRTISQGHRGTLLGLMSVDDAFVSEINSYMDTQRQAERNAVIKGLELVKSKFTVFSLKSLTGNYASIPNMIIAGGYAKSILDLTNAGTIAVRLWKNDYKFTDKPAEDHADTIVAELQKQNLIKRGENTLDIQRADPQILARFLRNVTTAAETLVGQQDSDAGRKLNQKFSSLIQDISQAYAFPDDIARIIPYAVNRAIFMSEAQRKIDRTDYSDNQTGENQYQRALVNYASDKAATIVRRDTVSFEINNPFVNKIVNSNQVVFVNNFVNHFAQMIRVMGGWHIAIKEDHGRMLQAEADAVEADSRGDVVNAYRARQEAAQWKSRKAQRIAGVAMTDTTTALSVFGRLSATTAITTAIAGLAGEDDPESKVEDKKYYTLEEASGASGITRAYGILNRFGADFKPVGTRGETGKEIYAADISRIAPAYSFNSNRQLAHPSIPRGAFNFVQNAVGSLINLHGEDTFFLKLTDAFRGIGPYGGKDDEGHWKTLRDFAVYYGLDFSTRRDIAKLLTGKNASGRDVSRASSAVNLGVGLPNALVKTDDVINQWSKFQYQTILGGRFTAAQDLARKMRIPETMTQADIQTFIDRMDKRFDQEHASMQQLIVDYRKFGYKDGEIGALLDGSGLRKDQAKMLLRGGSPYREAAAKYIENKIKDLEVDKSIILDKKQLTISARNYQLAANMLRN